MVGDCVGDHHDCIWSIDIFKINYTSKLVMHGLQTEASTSCDEICHKRTIATRK